MTRVWIFLSLAAVSAAVLAQQAPNAGPPKIQALIITGQNGHDWKGTTPMLRKMLEDSGRFEVRVTEEFRGAGPESLAPYDVVIVNYFERKRPELRWGERSDSAFLNYAKSGKGVVLYHFTLAAFEGWDEFDKMSAGNWRTNNGHHSARHDYKVDVKDEEHPITKGMKTSFPEFNDELYANLKWQPANTFHVLATAWDDHALYMGKARQPIPGPGKDEPMLWTLNYGQGRVFVTALGHDTESIKNLGFITTFQRGTEWAATGAVTIPVPPLLAK
jgi:type 1 glutamine amidotransferase